MTTFQTTEEFASVGIAVGGRAYSFQDGLLVVELEADAKRVRVFAAENPHLNIVELDAAEAEPEVEPVAAPAPGSDPSDPNDDGEQDEGGDAPDPAAAALEGADAPDPVVTDADAPVESTESPAPAAEEKVDITRLNRDALVELAAAKGIATEGLTKAQIRAALAE